MSKRVSRRLQEFVWLVLSVFCFFLKDGGGGGVGFNHFFLSYMFVLVLFGGRRRAGADEEVRMLEKSSPKLSRLSRKSYDVVGYAKGVGRGLLMAGFLWLVVNGNSSDW